MCGYIISLRSNIFLKDPQLEVIASAKENSSFLAHTHKKKEDNIIRESCSSSPFEKVKNE